MSRRLVLIGLDGAPPDLLFKWAKKGLLPNVRGLVESGVHGYLRSTIPPTTCPAWTSSTTGVDIYKHGIYDFFLSIDFKRKRIIFADSRKRKVKALWNLLNEAGRSTIIMNMPVTYPPEKVNGVMVTGMLTPSSRSSFTYPPSLKRELLDMGYVIDIGETLLDKVMRFKRSPAMFLAEVMEMVRRRAEAFLYLLRSFDWDLAIVVFVALDRVNHLFWRYIDPGHIAYRAREARAFLPYIMKVYAEVDEAVGKIIREAGPDANVILYSDHGFCSLNYFVFINNLLAREGLLHIRSGWPKLALTHELYMRLSSRLPVIEHIRRLFGSGLTRLMGHFMETSQEGLTLFDIDPEESVAFQLGQFVHINEDAAEELGGYRKAVEEVTSSINKFYAVTHTRAYTREELSGLGVAQGGIAKAPEITLLPGEGFSTRHLITKTGELLRRYDENVEIPSLMWCGDHALHGTLVMAGPGVQARGLICRAKIIDIAPTALKMLGEDIPSYMDGRPLI